MTFLVLIVYRGQMGIPSYQNGLHQIWTVRFSFIVISLLGCTRVVPTLHLLGVVKSL